jgi:hypothetical protein
MARFPWLYPFLIVAGLFAVREQRLVVRPDGAGPSSRPTAKVRSDFEPASDGPDTSDLPMCDDLMRQPNSPFRDGNFLASHATPIRWAPRRDGSRQLELKEICRLKRYTSQEANQCLAHTHVSMIGDSLTRYQYLSLAYFLEHGKFPPRFGGKKPAPVTSTANSTANSTAPGAEHRNIADEHDWGGFNNYFAQLGGGDDGGIMNGRMECKSYRAYGPGEGHENTLYSNGDSRALLSYVAETGFWEVPVPVRGFFFTNCSSEGTCRRTAEDSLKIQERSHRSDLDWRQAFPEAIDRNGTLRDVLPRPDVAIYNRGVWRQLEEYRAKLIMPVLHDWVAGGGGGTEEEEEDDDDASNHPPPRGAAKRGRCFFKSTTAHHKSLPSDYFATELRTVRPHVYNAGCSYLDYAYLTEPFAALYYDDSMRGKRSATERPSVFIDAVSPARSPLVVFLSIPLPYVLMARLISPP